MITPPPTLFEVFGDPKLTDNSMERAVKTAAFESLDDPCIDDWYDRPLSADDRRVLQAEMDEAMKLSFALSGALSNTEAERRDVWMQALGMLCEAAPEFGVHGTVHGVALKFDEIDPRAQASMIESAAVQLEQDPDSEEVQDYVRRQYYSMTVDTVGLLTDPAMKETLAEVLHRGISVFLQRHLQTVEPLPNECKILGADGKPAQ